MKLLHRFKTDNALSMEVLPIDDAGSYVKVNFVAIPTDNVDKVYRHSWELDYYIPTVPFRCIGLFHANNSTTLYLIDNVPNYIVKPITIAEESTIEFLGYI